MIIMPCFWYVLISLDSISISKEVVSTTCWIRGMYVYKELQSNTDNVAYFGIPKNISIDGILSNGTVCVTQSKHSDCKPMHKTFFLQVCIF